MIPPDGTATTNRILYTYAGDTVTVEDQTGKKRKSQTDALGRMFKVYEPDEANSNQLTLETVYTNDVMNNLTQIAQGSQTRSYTFDGLSRKTQETTPEAGTVSYAYNSDSLLTTRTDARGVVTTYTYDSTLNRLTQISYNVSCCSAVPSTSSVSYTYGTSAASNNNGRVTQMTDGPGQENYTYDSMGRVTQVQKKIYNVTYTTGYAYNSAGEVTSMTYPSGRSVSQSYDAIGRLTGAGGYTSSAAYNAASLLTGVSYGNGVSASFGYSADRLQMTSLVYTKSSQTLLSLAYSYSQSGNNNGQIARITDNVQGGRTVAYTYDVLHRLKTALTNGSAGYPQWGLEWLYDRYGNRKNQNRTHGTTAPDVDVTVSASTNQITQMSTFSFSYDSNGNLTQDDLYKYKYDAENRMVELRLVNNTLVATYAYDGNSLRVIKVVGADRTWYLYSGTSVVSEFEDAASATYNAGTTPGAWGSWDTKLYQHSDHLTTRLTTENSGLLSNEQGHYPYGDAWYVDGQANPSVMKKFTSYEKDTEASAGQIHYAVFRELSARIGRFHRPDPVQDPEDPQGFNRYAYVGSDPSGRIDPSGQEWDFVASGAYVSCQTILEWMRFGAACIEYKGIGGGGGGPAGSDGRMAGPLPGMSGICPLTPPFFPGSQHPLCGSGLPQANNNDGCDALGIIRAPRASNCGPNDRMVSTFAVRAFPSGGFPRIDPGSVPEVRFDASVNFFVFVDRSPLGQWNWMETFSLARRPAGRDFIIQWTVNWRCGDKDVGAIKRATITCRSRA